MPSDTLAPGLRLSDRYTLVRALGSGGMAAVWEAENEAHQRVAIKMLASAFSGNADLVARFFLEARAASLIAHPGIVRVLDSGQTPWGTPFLVMEELVGLPLDGLLERHGRFSPAQAAAVLVPVLDAVAAAHGAGVIHRDLKPGNVFITLAPTPAVKLLDFGISKVATADARLTQTGMVFGTPAYMSPEQVRDAKDATAVSDVYSVAAMAFELLTGAPPFQAESPFALAARVLNEDAPSLQAARPELPEALCRLIDRALSKDPALRPQRAHLFKEQLEALVPPDTSWLFTRVPELRAADAAPLAETKRARSRGPTLSLAQLVDRLARTGSRLPPAVAVRLAYDLLLDPATPSTFSPAQVLLSADGHLRVEAGAPLKTQRGAKFQSFVAPEAWEGHPSALSTQFSAGAVLLHALTGQAPFEAETEDTLRARLLGGVTVALPAEVPAALGPVLARMVSADPLHRYPDAGACAGELAAPVRASPHFSRATEELAALWRTAQQVVVKRSADVAVREPSRGVSGVGALLVALVALGGGIGIGVWRLKQAAEVGAEVELVTPVVIEAPVDPAVPGALREDPAPGAPSEYSVKSEPPGAALWLDGVFSGNAPGRLTLPQGQRFTLRLELPAHRPLEVELRADGQPHPLYLPMTSDKFLGRVQFDLADATRLWLDDVLVAEGRVELPVEANRTHHFQLEQGGQRSASQDVRVLTGEVKTLRP